MDSHADRIAWLEGDIRTLTARLESLERSLSSERWGASDNVKKLKRDLEDEIRDVRSDVEQQRSILFEYRAANEQDKHTAFSYVAEHLAWLRLVLWALGAISLGEAIAIVALWRR